MTVQGIGGYSFGEVETSPVSMAELEDLKNALGFTQGDHDALRRLWDHVGDHREALFEAWVARIGHFFGPTFGSPDGGIDERYMAATHPRFLNGSRTRACGRTTRPGSTTSTR